MEEELLKLKEENEELKNQLKKKNHKKIIIGSSIIALILIISGIIYYFITRPYIKLIGSNEIEYEVGKEYVDLGYKIVKTKDITIHTEDLVDTDHIGNYEYIYKVTTKKGKTISYKRKVKVVDNTPPTIEVNNDTISIPLKTELNDSYWMKLLEIKITDNYDDENHIITNLIYDKKITDIIGNYELKIDAQDSSNNASVKIIKVKVEEIKIKEINLNKSKLSLYVNSTETLTASIVPENTTNKSISWYSTDEGIASVDQQGTVTAKAAGNANICVKSEEDTTIRKCASITVKNKTTYSYSNTTNNKPQTTTNNATTNYTISVIKCEFTYQSFTHTARIDTSIRNDSSATFDYVRVKIYTIDANGNTVDTRTTTATDANFAPGDVAKAWIPTEGVDGYSAKCVIDGYSRVHKKKKTVFNILLSFLY